MVAKIRHMLKADTASWGQYTLQQQTQVQIAQGQAGLDQSVCENSTPTLS